MMIGIIYDSQSKPELSEKHYRAALEIDPLFAPAANNLAYILADSNRDLNDALKLARLAKEKLPDSPNVMDTLGWVYYKKKSYPTAVSLFKESTEKFKDSNPTVLYHLAQAHDKNGDEELARQSVKKALAINSEFPEAQEAKKLLASLGGK